MEKKEMEIQVFNNDEYFRYDTIKYDGEVYDIFSKIKNPESIIIVKLVIENNEEFYEILENEEFDDIMSVYYQKITKIEN